MRDIDRWVGVNASMALPMTAGFAPDLVALRRYAGWLADQGVIGVTVNADTGEGAHLSLEERVAVVAAVKEEVGDEVTVVSGLIAAYTEQAVELATALRDAGADGLLMFGIPAFNGSPLPPELVVRYFDAVGEVGLPLIGFNLTPSLGGIVLAPDAIARLAGVAPLCALKEASFDAATYVASRDALRAAAPDVALLSGCDNFMHESFVLGADGALLGYAGLAAGLTREVFDADREGRYAEAQRLNRERMQPLAEVLFGLPVRNSRARIKEGLKLLGVIDEVAVRPPLLGLDDAERAALRAAMKQAGLL
ncbi:dihydrodipicolinate synthase family protein [Conexibacter stalactiti]|uniref:Dihydrodipicolinate synthase family protein n=1 Tax=Conexibacter stalactiti TaxID=1940611 RepID=A0ABU4HXL5_9ACTN|nr:dihydrodipicolinate synthase family protein [Conexibacter stalactiti]MDW5597427.1 dihydrodipicolinate synthase family protein [Conexibacter stalactiti]MEC5038069.1 dihydrodipicolinate synthase family protein [Conexibacter stalactiti]